MRFPLAAWLVVDALATYRLVMLVTHDKLTERLRLAVGGVRRSEDPFGDPAIHIGRPRAWYFITCPWCTSVYIAAGAVLLTVHSARWWSFVALALAFSGVSGFLAERS